MSSEPEAHRRILPRHIAIIMDGNGRWAVQQGLSRPAGHREGVKATRAIVEACAERDIDALTLFAFSSENWNRPRYEVSSLMSLFLEVLEREVKALDRNGIRLRFIGAREQLPEDLQRRLSESEAQTAGNTRMSLVLAVAYGGRWDIVQAIRQLLADSDAGGTNAADIDEQTFSRYLSLAGESNPDLLIRTGGEQRVSNFLLWDIAYTELYFTDTLWPEFTAADLDRALVFYADRERRFGKTAEQAETGVG